jgi:L-rhamnose-H+ transport protein
MSAAVILGCLVVAGGGLVMGSGAWPFKLMRVYKFEHWWLIGMFTGLIVLPWAITLLACPDATGAIRSVWQTNSKDIIFANLLSMAWGVANVLCALCFIRIGVALTGAILTGIGATVGVITPLFLKSAGMGKFSDAPNIFTPAGMWVIAGLAIMLIGVVSATFAGFGRDKILQKDQQQTQGSFAGGLVLTVIAGVLSAGLALSFVYSQGPVIKAMQANGAAEFPASISVWALGVVGGALVNVLYPIFLLTKNKTWGAFATSWKELLLSLVIGVNFIVAMALAGFGMVMVGAMGASVGIGVQQAAQIMGGQGLGFISGEWRGIHGKPRMQMYAAILLLVVAAVVMTYGNNVLNAK